MTTATIEKAAGQTAAIQEKAHSDFSGKSRPCGAMVSGFGQLHTDEADPKKPEKKLTPYTSIDLEGIRAMVDKPKSVPKEHAQWLIPSTLPSRTFKTQEANGQFWMLWADLDNNTLPFAEVQAILKTKVFGDFDHEIYSSRSATKEKRKGRIFVPLDKPLTGASWVVAQQIFNDMLKASGIEPDRRTEGAAQLCYLPNRGDFYESVSSRGGKLFNPLKAWAAKCRAKRMEAAQRAAEAEAAKLAAQQRKEARQAGGEASAVEAFNASYTVEEVLLRASYDQQGDTFRHPQSESGSFSASVKEGRVHALSSSDPLFTGGSGGGAHDAFSAFTTLYAEGDHTEALKLAGDAWLAIDGESWNKVSRREYAKQKSAADDFGSTGHPLANFVDFSGTPLAPRWVIPGFIGHGVTVISGGHGVGKTTALVPLAMVAAGLHLPQDALAPKHWRHVVYICEDVEQARRIIAGRTQVAQWFPEIGALDIATVKERFHLVAAKRLDPLAVAEVGPTYAKLFTRQVGDVAVLPLVVLDTKSAVIDLENENDNAEASKAMAALKQGFSGLPVWLIGHVAKENMGRADVAALSSRGAGAFEADANQVLYLIKDDKADVTKRYLVRGKTRFEARWPELEISTFSREELTVDEYGDMESTTLRWGIAKPPVQSRADAKEQRSEANSSAFAAELRQEVMTAVSEAWESGAPLNRERLRSKVKRKASEVLDCVAELLADQWLHEVEVPRKERIHPKQSSFFICLSDDEHTALTFLNGALPAAKMVIPDSWKRPVSSIPEQKA